MEWKSGQSGVGYSEGGEWMYLGELSGKERVDECKWMGEEEQSGVRWKWSAVEDGDNIYFLAQHCILLYFIVSLLRCILLYCIVLLACSRYLGKQTTPLYPYKCV